MNCNDIREVASLYLTGELDEARAREFATHLTSCSDCAREIGEHKAVDDLIRAHMLVEPLDVSRIEQSVRTSIRTTSRHRVMAVLALAAVIVLAFGSYQLILSARTKAIYSAAARDHRREIVERQPRKWQTGVPAIERLAASQGVQASVLSALMPAGYRLAQGRLCLLNGRLFVHLLYSNASGNFSLFLRTQDTPNISGGASGAYAGEQVAGFQTNSVTALIVMEASGDEATRLANSISSAL